ncbi:MAG: hypothetical protein IKM35_04655 [Bacteroidaceae bacterium]|nr:hypothetical protein [Muribaculaceae bacterium]MBR6757747.1 hypothetical protein [Bacteroidaceae bacterium]
MPTKAYFIGLGGCGLKTVSELQQKLCPNGVNNQDPNGDVYQFTYIDTDLKTLEPINKNKVVIRNADFVSLGATNPYLSWKNAQDNTTPEKQRLNEWMIPQEVGNRFVLPNQTLAEGAGAERMRGRTGVYYCYENIYREITTKLSQFAQYVPGQTSTEENVWVIASSCGGTGSSITMDVLYMINKIVNRDSQHAPNLKLVLFMPQPFIDCNRNNVNYPLNAYSYMWEANAFRKVHQDGKGNMFKYFSVLPDSNNDNVSQFELFRYIIPVDYETTFYAKIELNSLYSTVAEMIYYLNKGTSANSMVSNMSNDMAQLRDVTHKYDIDWTRPLVSYGYRVVKKANDALSEYIRIRGTYEVLKYGLMGTELPEDQKETVKKEFGKETVLRYLCDLDAEGVQATDGSLQNILTDKYQERRIPNGEFTTSQAKAFVSGVEQIQGDELNIVKNIAIKTIKEKINEGVKKAIIDHGIDYALDLLHIVDDFYLEKYEVTGTIKEMYNDASEKIIKAKQVCEKLYNKNLEKVLKSKEAATLQKALKEYRDWKVKEQLYKISLEILDELTKTGTGYLEILRKKGAKTQGLREVYNRIVGYCGKWEEEYRELARKFRSTSKDVFTVTIPDLSAIATGENSTDWARDHVFDRLYCTTVIDYDRERELGSGQRIPLRKGETGTNHLDTYVEPIADVLLEIALSEGNVLTFERDVERKVFDKIRFILDEVCSLEGTSVSGWLNMSLEQILDDGDLPRGMTKDQFYNMLDDKDAIPVLYPKLSGGATKPKHTRYIYATDSQSLATKIGYNPNDTQDNQFVQDTDMSDRILIMKMELGLDFVSYKYFDDIQRVYENMHSEIKNGDWGCHLHREFANSNIEKSVREIEARKESVYASKFFKMYYYQTIIDVLKEKDRDTYNNIFGIFEFDTNITSTQQRSNYDFLFADSEDEENSSNGDFEENSSNGDFFSEGNNVCDKFFDFKLVPSERKVHLKLSKVTQEVDKLVVDNNSVSLELGDNEYKQGANFINGLIANKDIVDCLKCIDEIETFIRGFREKYSPFTTEIRHRLQLESVNDGNLKLMVLINQWRRKPVNEHIVNSAREAWSGQ